MSDDTVSSIALQRIRKLFDLAEVVVERNPSRARQYVQLARKISSRNKSRIPAEYQKKFCKQCSAYWKQTIPARQEPFLVYTCQGCGAKQRVPIEPKKEKYAR